MHAVWIGFLVGIGLAVFGGAGRIHAGEQIEPEGNIIAAHLAGMWESEQSDPVTGKAVFVYRQDPGVLTTLLGQYRRFLLRKRVYSAGTLTRDGAVVPAVVIELNGNPCLLTFQGDRIAGQYLAIVPGGRSAADRLFLGGGQPEDAFQGFVRRETGNQG